MIVRFGFRKFDRVALTAGLSLPPPLGLHYFSTESKKSSCFTKFQPMNDVSNNIFEAPDCLDEDSIIIYTDGACTRNGMHSARAGFGVHFPGKPSSSFCGSINSSTFNKRLLRSDDVGGAMMIPQSRQTNQRAELIAIHEALVKCLDDKKTLDIRTDSMYAVLGLTRWYQRWSMISSNGHAQFRSTSIRNLDLFRSISELAVKRSHPVYIVS